MVVAIGPVLKDALKRGMTYAEAAGFLSRDEDAVRKKAKQMKIPYTLITEYDEGRECVALSALMELLLKNGS
jgi:hypothetical protein